MMNKEEIQNIKNCFYRNKFFGDHYKECIDWAVTQLENENSQESICILAGLDPKDYWNIKKMIEEIINEELIDNQENNETWAGKYIVELSDRYLNKEITINDLDEIISKLYYKLNYPNWLDMLARNCEYATDIGPFQKPFNDELQYIIGIWMNSIDIREFRKKYDRKISQSHDFKFIS